jgi:predicted nuclease with RNAse H fold
MTTLIGIDAATKAKNIGLARGRIDDGAVVIEEVMLGSEIESVASTVAGWIAGPTVIAVDAPLGWPAPMATALSAHRAGEKIALDGNDMFARLTDRTVHRLVGKRPLEVGANLIARAALATLDLIEQVREVTGLRLPLLWTLGPRAHVGVIEVYPAATLLGRGLATNDYKKKDEAGRDARRRLVGKLLEEVELLPERKTLEICTSWSRDSKVAESTMEPTSCGDLRRSHPSTQAQSGPIRQTILSASHSTHRSGLAPSTSR